MRVTQLPIWIIPAIAQLPTAQVETLQVLADLEPFISLGPRHGPVTDQQTQADAEIRHADFEDWTAQGARLGLLTWPERDTIVNAIRRLAEATP